MATLSQKVHENPSQPKEQDKQFPLCKFHYDASTWKLDAFTNSPGNWLLKLCQEMKPQAWPIVSKECDIGLLLISGAAGRSKLLLCNTGGREIAHEFCIGNPEQLTITCTGHVSW